jgi:hypothetical protein
VKFYTDAQIEWMKKTAHKKRYRTAEGRLRVRKLVGAFKSKFGETRTCGAFGHKLRETLGTSAPKRSYERKQAPEMASLTALEGAARSIIAMVEKIRSTMF